MKEHKNIFVLAQSYNIYFEHMLKKNLQKVWSYYDSPLRILGLDSDSIEVYSIQGWQANLHAVEISRELALRGIRIRDIGEYNNENYIKLRKLENLI